VGKRDARIGETAWELKAAVDAEAEVEATLPAPETPFNHPVFLGPIWITVARQNDPWISIPDTANDTVIDSTQSEAFSDATDADAPLNSEESSGSSLSRMPQSSSQTI
jgi:type III secretion protein D